LTEMRESVVEKREEREKKLSEAKKFLELD
jgi:hypothetical protein